MRPKFAVGEVVLLRSIAQPECNGEYTVGRIKHYPRIRNALTGELLGEGYLYILEGITSNNEGWCESALRKKHYPGELSFDDLMASLSSPKLLTHDPQ